MTTCFADWTIRNAENANLCQLTDWLCWNDPNGCYTDGDTNSEGLPTLDWSAALALVIHQINNA
jgi:hypothetical protein